MKKLTREERRRRSQRRLQLITYLLFLLLRLAWLGSYLIMTVEAELPAMHKPEATAEDDTCLLYTSKCHTRKIHVWRSQMWIIHTGISPHK